MKQSYFRSKSLKKMYSYLLTWPRAWAVWIPRILWFHSKKIGLPVRRAWLGKRCLDWYLASSYFMIQLVWVPSHNGIAGNCKADELSRTGISVSITAKWEEVGAPLPSCSLLLNCWASDQLGKQWSTTISHLT